VVIKVLVVIKQSAVIKQSGDAATWVAVPCLAGRST